jgi:hypothetical protein
MEKQWQYFAMIIIMVTFSTLIYFILSPKKVIQYELGNGYGDGIPCINANIDNTPDHQIRLSKEIGWHEAINMVDSLNKTIK